MPDRSMPIREAARIAQKLTDEFKLELIDVELVKEPTGKYLRIYVEKPEGGVTLDELEVFHKRIRPLLERVDYDFMEVSSPGADRPLKTERDFERAEGMVVELKTYRPINGIKHALGELMGLTDGVISLKLASGEVISFNKKDVAIVRPYIDFNEEDLGDDAPVNE